MEKRADYPDFELTAGRYWSGNPNRRHAPADYPIDDAQFDISAVLYNAVAGGTVIYAAHWPLTSTKTSRHFYERVEADCAPPRP